MARRNGKKLHNIRCRWIPPKMEVDTNWPWHMKKIPFMPIRLARPRILHGPKHVFLDRNGTNDHESFVPFRSFPCSLEGRPKLYPV